MACNENIIKNMANEVTRNCQTQNVNVEPEFVAYLIELLLLNPKYGKLFTKTLNRNSLAHFVNECVAIIVRGGTSLNTLKMQFIMRTNYDKMSHLIAKHIDSVNTCLKPLVVEILDADPNPDDEAEIRKLYRKISIYIVLSSGLGNPSIIMNLKEGMAALESVFSIEELTDLILLPRVDRMTQVQDLMQLTSGVRLFNRDCKMGGDMIPDLPFDLVDAGKACLSTLSNSLIAVMQRVNTLTTAIEDQVSIHDETGNVMVDVIAEVGLTLENYYQIFELLIFNRQYEVYIRRLLTDVESMVYTSKELVEKYKIALEELHSAVKYKAAVPCDTVFPLFKKLWEVWRAMQNTMFLVSTVNRLMAILNGIQEHNRIPYTILEKMLRGKTIVTDEDRIGSNVNMAGSQISGMPLQGVSSSTMKERHMVTRLPNDSFSTITMRDRHIAFLGFCAMCLNVGALVPSNLALGVIRHDGVRYGFCSVKMAVRFNRNPDRYVNEVLEYARNNIQIINLLGIDGMVRRVKDVECIVTKYLPKKKTTDRDIQTEVHPIDSYKEHNYHWDLWEWKRRACQWANIVNCQTHSTQTNYSHLRSEIHCQTFEPRDKCLQTKKSTGMNTNTCKYFLWGLRGQLGQGQHVLDMVPRHAPEKLKVEEVLRCSWPCVGTTGVQTSEMSDNDETEFDTEREKDFYRPDDA